MRYYNENPQTTYWRKKAEEQEKNYPKSQSKDMVSEQRKS